MRLWKQTERFVYMLLEILFPLFCIKKQNVIQSYEFLPSSERKLITLFSGNLNKWKPESYPPGDVLLIYAEKRASNRLPYCSFNICHGTFLFGGRGQSKLFLKKSDIKLREVLKVLVGLDFDKSHSLLGRLLTG